MCSDYLQPPKRTKGADLTYSDPTFMVIQLPPSATSGRPKLINSRFFPDDPSPQKPTSLIPSLRRSSHTSRWTVHPPDGPLQWVQITDFLCRPPPIPQTPTNPHLAPHSAATAAVRGSRVLIRHLSLLWMGRRSCVNGEIARNRRNCSVATLERELSLSTESESEQCVPDVEYAV